LDQIRFQVLIATLEIIARSERNLSPAQDENDRLTAAFIEQFRQNLTKENPEGTNRAAA
jgi:hypothetical protein